MSSLNIRSFDQTLTIFAGGNFNVRQLDHHRTYKRRRCPQSTIFDLPVCTFCRFDSNSGT
ncbi:hypothetical protein RDWZM_003526, partial [Blomia tropicalis]